MNKPVYLGLLIFELSKIVMYVFWYDYVKPKYDEKAKLRRYWIQAVSLYTKENYIHKSNAEDFKQGLTRFMLKQGLKVYQCNER